MTQKYIVRLSIDERKKLFQLLDEGRASKEKQNRARILLKADWEKKVKTGRILKSQKHFM